VFFIGLFLTFRWIERRRERSQEELLVNAADMVKEILIDGAQSDEVDRAIALLRQSGDESGIALALRQSILSVERGINHPPSAPARIAQRLHALHGALIQHRWFHRMTLLVFAGNAIAGVLVVILTVAWDGFSLFSADERSLAGTGQVAGASLAWCCSTIGTIRLRQSRISAYRWFKRSVLAMIFFAQVFLFIQSQALALAGLAANLLLLGGINAMLRAEYLRREASQEP
jgi:hypothetical protein